MPATTRSTFPASQRLELKAIHGDGTTLNPEDRVLLNGFYDATTSDKDFERYVEAGGLPDHVRVEELEPAPSGSIAQSFTQDIVNFDYSLSQTLSMNFIDDNKWSKFTAMAGNLGESSSRTMEGNRANFILSNAIGGDGVPLFDNSHPNANGGTYSNTASAGGTLSEATLTLDVIALSQQGLVNGELMKNTPRKLLVGMPLWAIAKKLFDSTLEPTNVASGQQNAINVFGTASRSSLGLFSGGFDVTQHIPNDTYFIRTSVKEGLISQLRMAPQLEQESAKIPRSMTWVSTFRQGIGAPQPRAVYRREA